jgi:DNA-3-methyladenine glycosylase I
MEEIRKHRCQWCGNDPLYIKYHDNEWGVPVYDDHKHFEFLLLESAQAGLSWITILRKRENYRLAYENFDPGKIAFYNENKIDELLNNQGIIRNKLKISASINNANMFIDIQNEFGTFNNYIWAFVGGKPVINKYSKLSELPPFTDFSEKLAKDLKQRGFKFLGPTTVYAHLQAAGLVNDHTTDCFRYKEIIDSYK